MRRQWFSLVLASISLMLIAGDMQKIQPAPTSTHEMLTLKGDSIEGTTFNSVDHQGHVITLMVRDVELDPTDSDQEIYLYTVFYRLNIQQPTPDSGMFFEAAWSPAGAVWIDRTRYPDAPAQLQQECPEKLQAILHPTHQQTDAKDAVQAIPDALIFNHSFDRDPSELNSGT